MKQFLLLLICSLFSGGFCANFTAVRTPVAPVIDGKIHDYAHFSAAGSKSICTGFFADSFTSLAQYQPVVFLSYDNEMLYIAGMVPCSDIKNLHSGPIFSWYDDLLQFVINNISIAVNCSGATEPAGLSAAAGKLPGVWTFELAIPWSKLKLNSIAPGKEIPFRALAFQTSNRQWLFAVPLHGHPQRNGSLLLITELNVPYQPKISAEDNF